MKANVSISRPSPGVQSNFMGGCGSFSGFCHTHLSCRMTIQEPNIQVFPSAAAVAQFIAKRLLERDCSVALLPNA